MNFTGFLLIVVIFFGIILAGVDPVALIADEFNQTSTPVIAASCATDKIGILFLVPIDGQMDTSRLAALKTNLKKFAGTLIDSTALALVTYNQRSQVLFDFSLLSGSSRDALNSDIDGLSSDTLTFMQYGTFWAYDRLHAMTTQHPERKEYLVYLADNVSETSTCSFIDQQPAPLGKSCTTGEGPNTPKPYIDQMLADKVNIIVVSYEDSTDTTRNAAIKALMSPLASKPSYFHEVTSGNSIDKVFTSLKSQLCN